MFPRGREADPLGRGREIALDQPVESRRRQVAARIDAGRLPFRLAEELAVDAREQPFAVHLLVRRERF
jgi:hypothetical protein